MRKGTNDRRKGKEKRKGEEPTNEMGKKRTHKRKNKEE